MIFAVTFTFALFIFLLCTSAVSSFSGGFGATSPTLRAVVENQDVTASFEHREGLHLESSKQENGKHLRTGSYTQIFFWGALKIIIVICQERVSLCGTGLL